VGNAKDRPGGIDGLKNRSGKCEGPAEGAQRVKEPEWEMQRTGAAGGDQRLFEKKSFIKKPKTSTKHCSNNTPVHYARGSH
jgi:hypothetical protein